MQSRKYNESDILGDLYEIGLTLAADLNHERVLELVVKSAHRVLRADIVVCYSYDEKTKRYVLAADIGEKRRPLLNREPDTKGVTGLIVHSRSPLISNNAQNEEGPYKRSPFTLGEEIHSVVGLPLKRGDEIVGVLYVNYRSPNRIDDRVLWNAELLANQAAVAIYNARLFDYLSQREEALSRFVEVTRHLAETIPASQEAEQKSEPTVKIVLDMLSASACELTGADCAVFYPYDPKREAFYEVESVGSCGLLHPLKLRDRDNPDRAIDRIVKEQGIVIYHNLKAQAPDLGKIRFIRREEVHAFVGIAVRIKQRHLGVLYVNFRTPHAFQKEELSLIELFASQAGMVLQMVRLLEREQIARSELEKLGLFNAIGNALTHRLSNVAGTTPVEARQIRRRLQVLNLHDAEVEHSLKRIEEDTARLLAFADSLEKLPTLHVTSELTSINKIITAAAEAEIPPQIRKIEQYAPDLPDTMVPRLQLAEVFQNIFRNAVEQLPNGGVIRIGTKAHNGRWIMVEIGDTGPGMDPATQEKIFDLFYSRKVGGLGWGLWWSRTFMRRIGGDIMVQSKLGEGSLFAVLVPVIPDTSSAVTTY
jgi:GAF domain-containing protein